VAAVAISDTTHRTGKPAAEIRVHQQTPQVAGGPFGGAGSQAARFWWAVASR